MGRALSRNFRLSMLGVMLTPRVASTGVTRLRRRAAGPLHVPGGQVLHHEDGGQPAVHRHKDAGVHFQVMGQGDPALFHEIGTAHGYGGPADGAVYAAVLVIVEIVGVIAEADLTVHQLLEQRGQLTAGGTAPGPRHRPEPG